VNSSYLLSRSSDGQRGSYPVETQVGSRASDFETEYAWSSGRQAMRAVVLHEYGGPEKLIVEDTLAEVRDTMVIGKGRVV
jgi:hypothetical protein